MFALGMGYRDILSHVQEMYGIEISETTITGVTGQLKLPPYSPELNPIEQVWQWLRQRHLSNKVFNGYEDIVDSCTNAWNTFRKNVDTVKFICSREWIKLTE